MAISPFDWRSTGPANGISGQGLADAVIAVLKKRKEITTVCDLGCGNGYLAGRLAAMGYDVVGVDASSTGIALAEKAYPRARFINGIIDRDLPQSVGYGIFDIVISSDVIEHLYRPSDLFEAAIPLLKPAGEMIVTTPYHGYWKNLVLSLTGNMDNHFGVLTDGGHIKFFSEPTLSRLFRQHGFSDLRFDYYGRAPWLWKNMICQARRGN